MATHGCTFWPCPICTPRSANNVTNYLHDRVPACAKHRTLMSWVATHGSSTGWWSCNLCADTPRPTPRTTS